jgi:hypothetical protein
MLRNYSGCLDSSLSGVHKERDSRVPVPCEPPLSPYHLQTICLSSYNGFDIIGRHEDAYG